MRRSSLRATLVALLSVMVVLTALTITGLSYRTARRNTLATSETILERVAGLTHERVRSFLEPPRNAVTLAAANLEQGVLDPADAAALEGHLFNALEVHTALSGMIYGDEAGNFTMVRRMADGALATKLVLREGGEERDVRWRHRKPGGGIADVVREAVDPEDTYDPRQRPWYAGARDAKGLYWTDVYVFWTGRTPGITVAAPVRRGDELQGVVAADVTLTEFSRFLASVPISEHGKAVLIDEQARLIASPDPEGLVLEQEQDGETALGLIRVTASRDAPLATLGRDPRFEEQLRASGAASTFRYAVDQQDFLATLRPIELGRSRWFVAVVAPEDDFLADVKQQNRNNLITAVVFGILALAASLLLATWISRSLKLLVVQSHKIKTLHLERDALESKTPFGEIQDVLAAFESTKTGLRAFQKYMPVLLVRQLLEEGEEPQLGGKLEEVTVYFSDLAGYTGLSEKLGPTKMARRLGTYMSAMSRPIQQHSGTVLQYVGDEIMAFWNAPLPVANHPVEACRAALEAARIAESLYADDEETIPMRTRFGLHTDRVTVGHFGSPDRMYYGAVGDGVNLASRIEGASKRYGTRILVSEATWTRVADHFEARMVDRIVVKGSDRAIAVYELLGEKGEIDPELAEARDRYEEAFQRYRARAWDEAIELFQEARRLRPDDRAVEVLLGRCRRYQRDEPPQSWDGEYQMRTK
ncbi:MAG: hypothetical protein JRI23_27480 [Deltaproteobacteria bacterium]|jgi:adenylate cyclase|nr:hypothetical protein [Deltaproteobacteria bacterium]MBW2535822.1 hypothetical protein [Deltaproteobacteria bacterium]